MKAELDLVRGSVTPDPKTPTTPSRKALRLATDALIADGQLDLTAVVERTCSVMLVVATALAQYEQDPQVTDFYEASAAMVENGRAVMDRGLTLDDWPTVRCGAVMLELTVRGICAALSVPYDRVLAELHQARQAGQEPDVRAILRAAGLVQPKAAQAANDPPPTPREHLADEGCWCEPSVEFEDPDTGARVLVHRKTQ